MLAKFLIALAGILAAFIATAAEIKSLPGFNGPLPSRMYSGYQVVDSRVDRRLFYMFAEAQQSPSTAPVILWLNGGPGCSSLFGFFTEHGPFTLNFTANGTGLLYNPYTWSTIANTIYLESPAGVGFSSSNNSADYVTGDQRTAQDSVAFLLQFFSEFPQFRKNPFYVTGESYGGHYVPELVNAIIDRNRVLPRQRQINIVGMMAGNPWTDPQREAFGVIDYWWQHSIMSQDMYNQIQQNCDYVDITFWIIYNVSAGMPLSPSQRVQRHEQFPLKEYLRRFNDKKELRSKELCFAALQKASVVQFGGVDILGIYLDVCNPGTSGAIPDQPNACAVNQMQTYLNLPAVQAAIHVTQPAPVVWAPCSPYVTYNFTNTHESVFPIYERVLSNTSLRVLVFSGDNDAIVPFTGTRRWIEALNRPVVVPFHEWYANTNGPQVGGWATVYDRMTFTTVRAAGHMVAFAQPQRALHMFRSFLVNGTL